MSVIRFTDYSLYCEIFTTQQLCKQKFLPLICLKKKQNKVIPSDYDLLSISCLN